MDPEVVIASWTSVTDDMALRSLRREVVGFAVGHGMAAHASARLAAALEEALASAVGRPSPRADRAPVHVAAALDDAWLSVWVTDRCSGSLAEAVDEDRRADRLDGLSDGLTLCALPAGGVRTVMEFALAPPLPATGAAAVSSERAP